MAALTVTVDGGTITVPLDGKVWQEIGIKYDPEDGTPSLPIAFVDNFYREDGRAATLYIHLDEDSDSNENPTEMRHLT